jgi:hypothetical protein
MSTGAPATVLADVRLRKCSFCAEEILPGAKKCKHCGEFVHATLSRGVGAIFAGGVVVACILAGMQQGSSEGVLAVGVWAIFVLLFAKMFAR